MSREGWEVDAVEMTWWGWLVVAIVLGAAEIAVVLAFCRAAASSTGGRRSSLSGCAPGSAGEEHRRAS